MDVLWEMVAKEMIGSLGLVVAVIAAIAAVLQAHWAKEANRKADQAHDLARDANRIAMDALEMHRADRSAAADARMTLDLKSLQVLRSRLLSMRDLDLCLQTSHDPRPTSLERLLKGLRDVAADYGATNLSELESEMKSNILELDRAIGTRKKSDSMAIHNLLVDFMADIDSRIEDIKRKMGS